MEIKQPPQPALPLLVLLALASALGITVAIALAGIAMLLAAPAYADEGNLLLERRTGLAQAELLFAESELHEDGLTRVVEAYHNPFEEPLSGVYLHRLPQDSVLEQLIFTVLSADGEPLDAPIAARHALLRSRKGAALVEHTAEIGPGESLRVELEYRTRSPRRVLALR